MTTETIHEHEWHQLASKPGVMESQSQEKAWHWCATCGDLMYYEQQMVQKIIRVLPPPTP